MPRPIWKGDISFGLVAIPVGLYPAENKNELHFHLLDGRDKSRVHYERVNEIGKEVPWDNVVKAYEVEKDNYVILKEEDFKRAAPEGFKSINIEEFVSIKEINYLYFERPYYAVPTSVNVKAYVLLRESLKKTGKVGVAKVVIRTKQYLSIIMPHENALVLNLIRFPQEIRHQAEFKLPTANFKSYNILPREITMATALIDDMSNPWKPEKYHDEYKETLIKWINSRMKGKSSVKKSKGKVKADDVVDFMSLLKKSMRRKSVLDKQESKSKKSK